MATEDGLAQGYRQQQASKKVKIINSWKSMLLLSLTLGLAPFVPEPHLFGKIRWVMGGAVGMGAADWFDLAMHGTPWILLIRALILHFKGGSRATS